MADQQPKVKLNIKNASHSSTFPLEVAPDTTVAELQRLIAESYPGKPAPSDQTVRVGAAAF